MLGHVAAPHTRTPPPTAVPVPRHRGEESPKRVLDRGFGPIAVDNPWSDALPASTFDHCVALRFSKRYVRIAAYYLIGHQKVAALLYELEDLRPPLLLIQVHINCADRRATLIGAHSIDRARTVVDSTVYVGSNDGIRENDATLLPLRLVPYRAVSWEVGRWSLRGGAGCPLHGGGTVAQGLVGRLLAEVVGTRARVRRRFLCRVDMWLIDNRGATVHVTTGSDGCLIVEESEPHVGYDMGDWGHATVGAIGSETPFADHIGESLLGVREEHEPITGRFALEVASAARAGPGPSACSRCDDLGVAGVMTASEPSWTAPLSGLSPRTLGKLVTV